MNVSDIYHHSGKLEASNFAASSDYYVEILRAPLVPLVLDEWFEQKDELFQLLKVFYYAGLGEDKIYIRTAE